MKIYSRIFQFIARFLDLKNYEVKITQRKNVIESFRQVWKTCHARNNNLKKARFVKKADTWNFSTERGRRLEDRVEGRWEILRSRAVGNREITRKIFRKSTNVWLIHRHCCQNTSCWQWNNIRKHGRSMVLRRSKKGVRNFREM